MSNSKVIPLPGSDDPRKRLDQKKRKILKDPVIREAMNSPVSDDFMDWLMREISMEQAKLRYEEEQLELNGEMSIDIISKRIKALETLGSMWLRRRSEMASKVIDVKGRAFQLLFEMLLEKFKEAMVSSSISSPQIGDVMTRFAEAMEGWEADAEYKMKALS